MKAIGVAALFFLGLSSGAALARDLQVEMEVLHIGGRLAPAELDALLADERLTIEAGYQPTRLIEGDTARRERTMPFGSRLFAISRQLELQGAQVERSGRTLRFRVADVPADHDGYRLNSLVLSIPVAPGPGRPQPGLSLNLLNPVPRSGAQETAFLTRHGAFDLGLRVSYRWSDARGAAAPAPTVCNGDVQPAGAGQYRFRPRHPLAGLMRFLASDVQSDPPSRPVAGRESLRMREPFPEPLTGWKLSRNHLLRLQVDGQSVERLSVYAEQAGPGHCRRARLYEALFAGGRAVTLQRSVNENECGAGDPDSRSVTADWLEDGSLARFLTSTNKGSQTWDGFAATADPACGPGAAPPSPGEVQALIAEMQRLRDAFVRR
ncbi:MAG TPA: hypothetical protein VFO57_05840 [Burkholderiales bacterium]|nr:hypothetical protein [Burkholderiales bacterium]